MTLMNAIVENAGFGIGCSLFSLLNEFKICYSTLFIERHCEVFLVEFNFESPSFKLVVRINYGVFVCVRDNGVNELASWIS